MCPTKTPGPYERETVTGKSILIDIRYLTDIGSALVSETQGRIVHSAISTDLTQ